MVLDIWNNQCAVPHVLQLLRSFSNTNRDTPWAAGRWGPKFEVKILDLFVRELQNLAPKPAPGLVGAQAVAFRAGGDKGAFYGCGFYGNQDTLNDQMGRHYFKNCYIEGEIDFIFGNGRSLYKVNALCSKLFQCCIAYMLEDYSRKQGLNGGNPEAFSRAIQKWRRT